MKKRVLTGIKPTGTPHLGNYLGAIRPALEMARDTDLDSYFFMADYHALTTVHDPVQLKHMTYDVAATWLAFGLDPKRSVFYRQSDIPQVFELSWILACFTPKGLMNRAHAYKALVDRNQESGNPDLDSGIEMGLYTYPILMAADILLFDTDFVPVGKDQVQHIEIARDIAGKLNQEYGDKKTPPVLKLPQFRISENTAVLPGLDGRKMSKSYNNVIPLFSEPKKLQKLINGIKTDSTPPEAPKDPSTSYLFQIFREFGTEAQIEDMRSKYENGISWGQAKLDLFEVLNSTLEAPRARYLELMSDLGELERILQQGADQAREVAESTLARVRSAIGMNCR